MGCSCSAVIATKYEADVRWEHLRKPDQLDKYSLETDAYTQMWLNLLVNVTAKSGAIDVSAKDVTNVDEKRLLPLTPAPIGTSGLFLRFTDDDEDLGAMDGYQTQEGFAGMLTAALFVDSQGLPLQKCKQTFFPTVQIALNSVKDVFHDLFDALPVKWEEFESDEVFSLLAFNGIGMHYLCGMPSAPTTFHDAVPNAVCQIDLDFMVNFATRDPYEKYGCICYFSADKTPLAIWWSAQKRLVFPNDRDWSHVKFVFRCTICTAVTAKDHLINLHWQVSNTLVLASRQCFDRFHPLRRLSKPHTYRAVKVRF